MLDDYSLKLRKNKKIHGFIEPINKCVFENYKKNIEDTQEKWYLEDTNG